MVYPDERKSLETCRKTCSTDLIIQLVNLLNIELDETDYENLNPYWTTCQYRCYRCHLTTCIQDMVSLQDYFKPDKVNTPFSTIKIATVISRMEQTFEDCYTMWESANNKNDLDSLF